MELHASVDLLMHQAVFLGVPHFSVADIPRERYEEKKFMGYVLTQETVHDIQIRKRFRRLGSEFNEGKN